ncbi:hypothetical protein GCM10027093_08560 [Paraburkholderia jirisanensis]
MTETARTSAHLLTHVISHTAGSVSTASPLGSATTVYASVEMHIARDRHSGNTFGLVLETVSAAQAMLAQAARSLSK